MKISKNSSGFTLIEIIVVLIIVGILAAIALPNLFSNVSKIRAEEALGTIGTYRPLIEACIVKQAGVNENNACNSVTLGAPTFSSNFDYFVIPPSGPNDTSYSIKAIGQGALQPADIITVSRAAAVWPATGAITCVGAGVLQGAC